MELLFSIATGCVCSCGIYLLLRGRTFPVVLGVIMLSYGVNLFLFSSGRLTLNQPAILVDGASFADPLPQALVLTAIVIGFAMTAFAVILAIRGRADLGNDHVNGKLSNDQESSE